MTEDIITESGVCYVVTDKGQMIADNTDPDDSTTAPPPPVITSDTAAGNAAAAAADDDDGDDNAHVDLPSILISADAVIDVKTKSAFDRSVHHVVKTSFPATTSTQRR